MKVAILARSFSFAACKIKIEYLELRTESPVPLDS
jgi:hypothetical protein